LTTWIGSSCDCSIAAADGAEDATGRARLDQGADEFAVSAVKDGATSGVACAMFCFAILDVPVLPRVATDVGFSVTGFSAGEEFFSATAFVDGFSAVDFEAGGIAIVLEAAAGAVAPAADETGCALPDGGKLAGATFAASCVCC
jgi:hypothetical protein